jgi:hypothetical protein
MKRFLSAIVLMVVLALGTFASLALGEEGGDGANDSRSRSATRSRARATPAAVTA